MLKPVLCLVIALASLASCSDPTTHEPCRSDATVGARFRITVLDAGTGENPCPPSFDLKPGLELSATVRELVGKTGDRCSAGNLEIAAFDEWVWSYAPQNSRGEAIFRGGFDASSPQCRGTVELNLPIGSDQLARVWIPNGAAAGCPTNCSDGFPVRVERLP